jgi:hypothetical protein
MLQRLRSTGCGQQTLQPSPYQPHSQSRTHGPANFKWLVL